MNSRIANVNPSLSTKNILKDYEKFKDYSNMRLKILNKRIVSFKKLEKIRLAPLNNDPINKDMATSNCPPHETS